MLKFNKMGVYLVHLITRHMSPRTG